jgi:hypothetical protein
MRFLALTLIALFCLVVVASGEGITFEFADDRGINSLTSKYKFVDFL